MRTVMEAWLVLPALSVAETVIVWLPTASVVVEKPAPVARVVDPSVQTRLAVRSPSSRSEAVAAKVISAPGGETVVVGAVIVTVGLASTRTVMGAGLGLAGLAGGGGGGGWGA